MPSTHPEPRPQSTTPTSTVATSGVDRSDVGPPGVDASRRGGPRLDAPPGDPRTEAPLVVDVRDVSVRLGGQPVLHGVSLQQPAGSLLALMGANGSGKTTLVRALLGLVPVEQGSVSLFGTPLRRFRSWSWIGYVPQRSSLTLRNATVGEVVMSGRLGHRRPLSLRSRRDREQVAAALERVGLSGRHRDEMVHLSGGQQQRALIARALAAEPRLLVMDEPLAGVDAASQRAVADVLADLVAEGLSATVVLHELGPLAPLLDRAVVLTEGRVSHDGAVSAVDCTPEHEIDETAPPRGLTFLEHPVSPDHRHDDRTDHRGPS